MMRTLPGVDQVPFTNFDKDAFLEELDDLARTLPPRSDFEHDLFLGDLRIVGLYLRQSRTGVGRRFREHLLALTDRYGLSTSMQADSTGQPGDPTTFELVRYYLRFGYVIDHIDDEAFIVEMSRAARPVRLGIESIHSDYDAARQHDLTADEFEALKGTILRERHPSPQAPRPSPSL